MGKETCHRSIFFISTLPKDDGFLSLIRSLRMLTFSVFGILTVKVRSGSSLRRKQLRERSCVGSRAAVVWITFRGVKSGSERECRDVPGAFAITWRKSSGISVKDVVNFVLRSDNFVYLAKLVFNGSVLRLLMGKETCRKSISEEATWSR